MQDEKIWKYSEHQLQFFEKNESIKFFYLFIELSKFFNQFTCYEN